MATGAVQTRPFTFEDFCLLVKDGQKGDLIDGVIYMASPENTEANELFGFLFVLIYTFVRKRKLGKVFGSRVAYKLDEYSAPEPDIGFVKKQHAHRIKRGRVEGPPDLALEVISPESKERDYQKKRRKYQESGASEYWIVDEMRRKVTLLRLDSTGKYREVRPRKGVFYSEVLPGFWLDPQWLWQQPLRDVLEIVQLLVAEAP